MLHFEAQIEAQIGMKSMHERNAHNFPLDQKDDFHLFIIASLWSILKAKNEG